MTKIDPVNQFLHISLQFCKLVIIVTVHNFVKIGVKLTKYRYFLLSWLLILQESFWED